MANILNGTTYIITFEFGTGANIDSLVSIIKSYGTWAKITDHTWAVVAMNGKAPDVRNKLLPFIGVGGRIFVIKSGYESAWKNTHSTGDWLQKYLAN